VLHLLEYRGAKGKFMRGIATLVFLLLLTFWSGMVLGVSFLATPVKFQVPSLTLQTAVEIGWYTFRLLARVELVFLLAALLLTTIQKPQKKTIVVSVLVMVVMALQRYWLLPVLDDRVSQLLTGRTLTSSIHHLLYAMTEAIKIMLLITGAVVEYHSQTKSESDKLKFRQVKLP